MRTSKLIYVVWVFFALTLTTTTVFGQGRGNGNRFNQNQYGRCFNGILGLTEDQQTQIEKMENKHQAMMAELREKRRSTTGAIEKSEIRTEMLKKVEAHRKEVRGVLTEDQQKEYDQLHIYRNCWRNQSVRRGQKNYSGRGKGNRNSCYSNVNFRGRGVGRSVN
jgi:Spy/CpxP family protein refolding chaperone